MEDHNRDIVTERFEYYLGPNLVFAELDTGGKIIQCPNCHVPFKPHFGNWMANNFPCESCNVNLTFRNTLEKTARCPCCHMSRPLPSWTQHLMCRGCGAKVVHQPLDNPVICSACKHINIPPDVRNYLVRPPNQDPQVDQVVPPQANQVVPPQANQVVAPQVIRVVNSQVNGVATPRANWVVYPEVNRVVYPQVNQYPPPSYKIVPLQFNNNHPQVYMLVPTQLIQSPPQANLLISPQVNLDLLQVHQPNRVNRVVPPEFNQHPLQVYQHRQDIGFYYPIVYPGRNRAAAPEAESSVVSSLTARSENVVAESPDDSVAESVRNVGIKREAEEEEEDKTEASGSKKIRL